MADTIKQEFLDQVLHALVAFLIVYALRQAIPTWWAYGVAVTFGIARECIQHRSVRLGFGSALDIFVIVLGATIGALI